MDRRPGLTGRGNLPTLPAGRVQVRVLNATAIPRLAARAARALTRLGFDVTGTGVP